MDDPVASLKELGFSEYEAKVYLSLVEAHPAGAYDISKNSGVPHSRVYDITRRLIEKGAVVKAGSNPDRFSPLPPADLVSKLRSDYTNYVDQVEEQLKELSFTPDFDPVWNIATRQEALDRTAALLGEAEQFIYIGIWDEELPELLPHLEQARTRGAELVFLIYGEEKPGFGRVYHHRTGSIKGIQEQGRTVDCVVDSAGCITGSLGGTGAGSRGCQVVWTRNRGLVKSIEEYMVHDFYIAELQNRFGNEIEEKFGKNLSRLRQKFHR